MLKTVTSGERSATVILDGTECEVRFSSGYNVVSVRAEGDTLIALDSGKAAGDDGTVMCKGGGTVMYPHMRNASSVFLTGSGKAEIIVSNEAVNPFKSAPVSGGGGGDVSAIVYSQLDSAYFSGGAVVDYIPSTEDIIEVNFTADRNGNAVILGTRTPNDTEGYQNFNIMRFQGLYYIGTGNYSGVAEIQIDADFIGTHKIEFNLNNGQIFVDDVLKATTQFGEHDYPMMIGNRFKPDYEHSFRNYIHNVIVRKAVSGEVIHKFIPVVIPNDVILLFDEKSQTAFYSSYITQS